MRKLVEADILDILPCEDGFIYLSRETLTGGNVAGVIHRYNRSDDRLSQATITDYIEVKFGIDGQIIAKELVDFITCKTATLHDGATLAVYPDGSYKIVRNGKLTDVDELIYLSAPACSPAVTGRDVWFAVPDVNAVINYSIEHGRVDLRIGGPATKAFCHPIDLKIYANRLYICNEYSYKIRCIKLDSYTVEDYRTFNEEVKCFFRSGENEYVQLKSGIYLL